MHHNDDSISNYIDWFEDRPDYLTRISKRAALYLYYIVGEVEARNMPIELALLPIVESAFYPFAHSAQNASGLWQFIPNTGLVYGLTQDWWYDARRDVVASTKAALQYLQNLNILFNGDWLLAIAAYNAGPGRVQRAIKINKGLGLPIDFWYLPLPKETVAYVPKLLAVLEIIRNPGQYQQSLIPIANQQNLATITLKSQLNVKVISGLSGLSVRSVYELNPGLRRWTTPPMSNYQLLLPKDIAKKFSKELLALPLDGQLEWVRHKRDKNEKITDIAKAYNIDSEHLEDINELGGFDPRTEDFIIVPILKQYVSYHALNEQEQQERLKSQRKSQNISYTVAPGDSIFKIARKQNVSVVDLIVWNDIQDIDKILTGDVLTIQKDYKINQALAKHNIDTQVHIVRKISYQIKKGDTLSNIAKRFKVSIANIKSWNKLSSNLIKYGENLKLHISIIE